MLCTHCKLEFDEKLNVPRLLVVCGHSLCESCCYRIHLNNRVECPTCHASTFIESISLLPKNLALITQPHQHEVCTRHLKKYEGTSPPTQPSARRRTSSSASSASSRTDIKTTKWTASAMYPTNYVVSRKTPGEMGQKGGETRKTCRQNGRNFGRKPEEPRGV